MSIFALIDCNSFFASCERVFDPMLEKRPLVVLSNNDGCAIARTAEAKKIGIKMGQPFYQFKHLAAQHKVEVRSSNFSLYGDMSHRVMETLRYFTDDVEIYSIDEAFLDLTAMRKNDLASFGRTIKQTVRQWTGIPVSIGIAETKTLAKAANELAKTFDEFEGVLDLTGRDDTDELLARLPVGDVWGIGRQYAKKLQHRGITSAAALKYLPDKKVLELMNVCGLRTVYELRGISTGETEPEVEPKKSITTTRSYRHPITQFGDLAQAIASYTTRAAEKLREQGSVCRALTVFIATNRFHDRYYSNAAHVRLSTPTAYFPELISQAQYGLKKIFRQGYGYKRSGVILSDITPAEHIQFDLFADRPTYARKQNLLRYLDRLNERWGTDTIKSAAALKNRLDFDGKKFKSLRFTTDWSHLLTAK